ncbi:hypothetical protein C8R47DRAFT_215619 [Mycena vitilis]|nr:hypothetical protein C8R47DRAFT_215619 [Mycena vitilis]
MDVAFGGSLIGTWLASFVFGLTVPQAFQYFDNFPDDGLLRRSLVASSLLLSFAGLIGEYANIYLPLVTFRGRPGAFVFVDWPVRYAGPFSESLTYFRKILLYNICNAMVALIVNSFLVSRFYLVSKNVAVTAILCGMVLFVFIMSLLSVQQFTAGEDVRKAKTNALITSISLALADFCIAASLIWTLLNMVRPFKGSRRIVRPIIITSLRNGCLTSLVTLGGMTAVVIRVGNVSAIFYYSLGPLYVLTLLSNLNLRRKDEGGESRLSSGSRIHSVTTPRASIGLEAAINEARARVSLSTEAHEGIVRPNVAMLKPEGSKGLAVTSCPF